MQTVSVADLAAAPLSSLWHLHIQPPALDTIRMVFAVTGTHCCTPRSPEALLQFVDQRLYDAWAALYAVLGVIVFRWLREATSTTFALGATAVLLLHPATLAYATFLDGTFVSAVVTTWLMAALWRLRMVPQSSITPLTIAVIVCYFTRSLYQWPFVLLIAVSLLAFGVGKHKIAVFLLTSSAVIGAYTIKQLVLFDTMSTTTFAGLNLNGSIGYRPANFETLVDRQIDVERPQADVLTRRHKIGGRTNYNNHIYLEANRQLLDEYQQRMSSTPLAALAHIYAGNARTWLLPSDGYFGEGAPHIIVEHLPWRGIYDRAFSFPLLPLLIGLAVTASLRQGWRPMDRLVANAGVALPVVYVIAISIAGERGENQRFKFFVEPVLFVFVATSLFHARRVWRRS